MASRSSSTKSDLQLETFVRCGEAKTFVEAVRFGAGLVRGELDRGATPAPGFVDNPSEHGVTKTLASVARADPHGFDLRSKGPTSSQTGDERELHRGDHLNTVSCHDEQLSRIVVDSTERQLIRP